MMFRYHDLRWYVETWEGWALLPTGTRPSDVVAKRPDAFRQRLNPGRRPIRRCDTPADWGLATARRVTNRVAMRLQRPHHQLVGRRKNQGLAVARGVAVLCARRLGASRDAIARVLAREPGTVTNYGTVVRRLLPAREVSSLCAAIVQAEREAPLCAAPPSAECRGVGGSVAS
jgi:hypothetical protein